jgi:hypothetical protein
MQRGPQKPAWINVNFMAEIRKQKHASERHETVKNAWNMPELGTQLSQWHGKQSRDYEKEIARKAQQNPEACYRYVNGKLKTRA